MKTITLIPGDGIGPEVVFAAKKVIDALNLNIDWEIINSGEETSGKNNANISEKAIKSITKNKVALKGPLTETIGKEFESLNIKLIKELSSYPSAIPVNSMTEIDSEENNIDMVIFESGDEVSNHLAGRSAVNPTASILAAAMMMDYIGEKASADLIRKSLHKIIEDSFILPRDLGGNSNTWEFTESIINYMEILKNRL